MKEQTRKTMSRRDFLKLLGAASVTAAGVLVLDTYTPWLNADQKAESLRNPQDEGASDREQKLSLVHYATLAANGHNTQPWKFAVLENSIQIHPDSSRRLAVVDPDDREMWISLGCALENMLLAATAAGYASEIVYPDAADFIEVKLQKDAPRSLPLFDAIPLRQSVRTEYDGKPIPNADFEQLQALTLEPGVSLRYTSSPADVETLVDYINQGNLAQYADPAFVNELIAWLRFNKKDALAAMDGLYSKCSGNPEVPNWLGKMFVSSTKPQQQAEMDAKKLRSSAGAVVIASDRDDRTAWVRTGQVFERLSLSMTALNIKSALLNQPVEVAGVRPQFQSALGLGESLPQLVMRYGYADAMPYSLRRPVEQVLI